MVNVLYLGYTVSGVKLNLVYVPLYMQSLIVLSKCAENLNKSKQMNNISANSQCN